MTKRPLLTALAAVLLASVAALAEPRVIDLAVKKGELPAAQRLIRVTQGDDVTLRWTTDAPLEIHLHGYDVEVKLMPGPPRSARFTAKAAGRFPIEAHGGGREWTIAYLEVHPR